MKLLFVLIFSVTCLFSCKPQKPVENEPFPKAIIDPIPDPDLAVLEEPIQDEYTLLEQKILERGFVDLAAEDSSLLIDLRYATMDNFLDTIIYDSIHHAFGVVQLSQQLKTAGNYLRAQRPGHSFVVFDCLRPRSVQRQMWDKVKNTPQQKYVAAPSGRGSMHNYGCAIDLTIADQNGKILDMGTEFDHFGPKAEYRYNQQLLKKGELTQEQVDNRIFFRSIMRKAGFHSIDSEWWHFNLTNRDTIRARYKMFD